MNHLYVRALIVANQVTQYWCQHEHRWAELGSARVYTQQEVDSQDTMTVHREFGTTDHLFIVDQETGIGITIPDTGEWEKIPAFLIKMSNAEVALDIEDEHTLTR